MRKRVWPVALIALAVVGCGTAASGGQTGSSTTPNPSTTAPPFDVIPTPDSEGRFPDDTLVSCGGGAFPIGAIDSIRSLNTDDPGGLADAIAPFLSGEEGTFWPQDGWQILHLTESQALLIAHDETGGLAFITAENDGSGWVWTGASGGIEECRLQFVVPEGLNTVDWRLDPDGPSISPDTAEVAVILNERECVGGIEIGDRLVEPQFVMTETQVFLAFAATPPEGDVFECQGNPDTPMVVTLPEPVGDRELVEGLDTGIILDDYVD